MKKSFLLQFWPTHQAIADALDIKQPTVSGWPENLPYSVIGRIAESRRDILELWWDDLDKGLTPTPSSYVVSPCKGRVLK